MQPELRPLAQSNHDSLPWAGGGAQPPFCSTHLIPNQGSNAERRLGGDEDLAGKQASIDCPLSLLFFAWKMRIMMCLVGQVCRGCGSESCENSNPTCSPDLQTSRRNHFFFLPYSSPPPPCRTRSQGWLVAEARLSLTSHCSSKAFSVLLLSREFCIHGVGRGGREPNSFSGSHKLHSLRVTSQTWDAPLSVPS